MALVKVPPELFEKILTFLDIDSIKALRLSGKSGAEMSLGPRFLNSIQQPSCLAFSVEALCSLNALASNSELSKAVHSLTLYTFGYGNSGLEFDLQGKGLPTQKYQALIDEQSARDELLRFLNKTQGYSTFEYPPSVRSELEWMRKKQEVRGSVSPDEMINILESVLKRFVNLSSIKLDSIVHPPEYDRWMLEHELTQMSTPWFSVWMRASHLFYLIVSVMGRRGIKVRRFSAYRDSIRCSIPSGDITSYISTLNPEQLRILGENLETLELSISTEIDKDYVTIKADEQVLNEFALRYAGENGWSSGHLDNSDPRAVPADGTPGIASLLKSTRALRQLNLHFRNALSSQILSSYDRIFEVIAHEVHLQLLEKCSLSGFYFTAESLVKFLQKHSQLRNLTLQRCELTSGFWAPIFDHLSQAMPELETLNLSTLAERYVQKFAVAQNGSMPDPHVDSVNDSEISGGYWVFWVNLHPKWDNDNLSHCEYFQNAHAVFVHTRSFNRDELEKGLIFRSLPERPLDFGFQSREWNRYIEAKDGAPGL